MQLNCELGSSFVLLLYLPLKLRELDIVAGVTRKIKR
jgi:hypothetical protein